MAVTDEAGASVEVAPALTFKERLAKRRKELESDVTFEIEVPGYEDLWSRYRVLGYDEIRNIGMKVADEGGDAIYRERMNAAATLAEACVELLEFRGYENGKPVYESTGYKWSAEAARDLFQVPLPDGVANKDAIIQIFPYPRDMLMMKHFEDYLAEGMGFLPEIEETLQRELPGASAATT